MLRNFLTNKIALFVGILSVGLVLQGLVLQGSSPHNLCDVDPDLFRVMTTDIDGDGEGEVICGTSNMPPETFDYDEDDNDVDGDIDFIILGVGGGQITIIGIPDINVDNDNTEFEVVAGSRIRNRGDSNAVDLDGDADWDIIWAGTGADGDVSLIANIDNDPNEKEIIVSDPENDPPFLDWLSIDWPDGDIDILWVGTRGGGFIFQYGCPVDNDSSETEAIVLDPTQNPGELKSDITFNGVGTDMDGDHDVIWVGAKGTRSPECESLDQDQNEKEFSLIYDEDFDRHRDIDIDGDYDFYWNSSGN